MYDVRLILITTAEAIDYFRVVPRMILCGYGYMTYEIVQWFMKLESPTVEQASLLVTIIGIASVVINLYEKSKTIWENPIRPKRTNYNIKPKINNQE
jgi:hypothetical protein